MGQYKGTERRDEPDDFEVLYFVPSYHEDGVMSQSVAIAPLDNNETSIIMSKMYENFNPSFTHFIFTEKETNMLINALLEVKKRWMENRVIE